MYKSRRKHPDNNGRPLNKTWITGDDPVRRDKYYSWMKHRAQAKFRNEEHSITWPEWELIWSDDLWHGRGRTRDCNCLMRIDPLEGWCVDNVKVVTNSLKLSRNKEYRQND